MKGNHGSQKLCLIFVLPFLVLMTTADFGWDDYIVSVPDYFPDLHGNLIEVVWAHAVNSQTKLIDAIEGDVMMLEADILMGTTPASDDILPIMAHPPNVTSDLSFQGFLSTVLMENNELKNKKGIKLDFKDIEAVEPVLRMLEREFEHGKLTFPVWLNADVLKGPVDATKNPINATRFLSLVKKYLPAATLSLGWTTRYGRDEIKAAKERGEVNPNLRTLRAKSGYTEQNVFEMMELLREKNWEGPVTFAVRAGLVTPKESRAQLGRLMTETFMLESKSFTVWSADDDPVNVKTLKDWIFYTQYGNVYIDLPFDLDEGPVLIPDPERPKSRTGHLQSHSSSSTRNVMSLFLILSSILLLSGTDARL